MRKIHEREADRRGRGRKKGGRERVAERGKIVEGLRRECYFCPPYFIANFLKLMLRLFHGALVCLFGKMNAFRFKRRTKGNPS